jgi:hypothetical protein
MFTFSNIDWYFFEHNIELPVGLRIMFKLLTVNNNSDFLLQIVVELFRQVWAMPFQASPTTWESLQKQIAIADR